MSIMRQFHRKRLYEGENGSGGGAPGTVVQTNQQQQQQQNNNNNGQDNVDDFSTIWQPKDNGTEHQQQSTNTQQQTTDQTGMQPENVFKDHLKSLNLTEGLNAQDIFEKAQNGDFTSFNEGLKSALENVYTQSLFNMNKIMTARIDKAVEIAVAKAGANNDGAMSVRSMQEKLPFTKSPEIAPIARAALARFMENGSNLEESISKVGKFFSHIHKMSAKDLGLSTAPRGRPGMSGNFDGGYTESEDEVDFIELLTGTPSDQFGK